MDSKERLKFDRKLYPGWKEILDTPVEERFEELFAAARMLLKERVQEEDTIFATLAFASEISAGVSPRIRDKENIVNSLSDSATRKEAISQFAYLYSGVRPVQIVDGILLLERPVRCFLASRVPNSWHVKGSYTRNVELNRSWSIVIEIGTYQDLPTSEEVVQIYEDRISRGGFSQERPYDALNVDFKVVKEVLRIAVAAQDPPIHNRINTPLEDRRKNTRFPHPDLIGKFYDMICKINTDKASPRYSKTRQGGQKFGPDSLILTCVAYYLRHYGELKGRKEPCRLINEYVLYDHSKSLPVGGVSSSEYNSFYGRVKNLRGRLTVEARDFYRR